MESRRQMSRKDNIKKLIIKSSRYLQKLKEKEASFGLDTPVHVLTEIEDTEAELEKLQTELATLKDSGDEISLETTGHGIEVENVDAKNDVLLSSSHSPEQTNRPSTIEEALLGSMLNAQALSAGGSITIQQFVGSQVPLTQQLEFFVQQIGLKNLRASNFINSQFKTYCRAWKRLQALRLAGDDLWERANNENLLKFAEQLRRVKTIVRKGEIFFEDKDRENLEDILDSFGDFWIGKRKLIGIRSEQQIEVINPANYYEEQIKRQIDRNHNHKVQYEQLLEKIRVSFKSRLSN